VAYQDSRNTALGHRILAEADFAAEVASDSEGNESPADAYHAHRVRLGVPEGGKDYEFGDAYPHEADFDIYNGVSFTKGCYVGQEVVARMQNKTIVRKRVVKIFGSAPLSCGTDVTIGDIAIGRVGTVAGFEALAMLRLDRAIEAAVQGKQLTSAGITIVADAGALERYRAKAATRTPAANPT
jgi:folate-binding protein YgfZ